MKKLDIPQSGTPENKPESQLELARAKIHGVISELSDQEPGWENFETVVQKLRDLRFEKYSPEIIDRAWTDADVENIINYINNLDYENSYKNKPLVQSVFFSILHTGSKNADEPQKETINEQVALSVIEILNQNQIINQPLKDGLDSYSTSLHMLDPKIRFDFLIALANNPGLAGSDLASKLMRGYGLMGNIMFNDLENLYVQKQNDPNTVLKILKILEITVAIQEDQSATQRAVKLLDNIKNQNDNYFISQKIVSTENFWQDSRRNAVQTQEALFCYQDNELLKKSPLPMGVLYHQEAGIYNEDLLNQYKQGEISKEEFLNNPNVSYFLNNNPCYYSRASTDYALIYNAQGNIDSFFQVGQEKNLGLKEILNKEAPEFFINLGNEKSEDILNNYKTLMQASFRKILENDFDIELKSFNIRQQLQFLSFLSSKTSDEVKKIKENINKVTSQEGKGNIIKSYLSLEIDQSNGEKILDIANTLSPEQSEKVFSKLAEIINYTNEQVNELNKIIREQNIDISQVRIELLKKVHEIIAQFTDQFNEENKNNNENIQKLIKNLENSKTNITLLSSVFRAAKNLGQKLNLEKIRDIALESKNILSPEEIEDIIKMSEENWQQIPALQKTVTEDLKNDLKSQEKEQEFIVLKYKGETIGFLRFEKRDNKTIHAGSLNVYKELRGLKIAEQSLLEIIKEKSKEKIVHATASPKIQAGTCYIEKTGFVGTGYIPDYHNSGEPLIEIEIDREKNNQYQFRREDEDKNFKISQAEIISSWKSNDYKKEEDVIILKYDFSNPEEFKKYHEDMQKLLNSNDYVMTRYFKDAKKEDKDERYLVLEKK